MDDVEEGYFMQNEEGSWELAIPFDTQDPEFARGFACGMIWQLMELDTPGIEMTVTSDNLIMCTIMADYRGYLLEMEESGVKATELEDADWLRLSFTKKEA